MQQEGKVKKSFMLHNVDGMHKIGKYMSNTFRQAALKAASNGHSKGHPPSDRYQDL